MNTSTDTPKASDPREDGRTIDVLGQWQRFVRGQPLSSPLRPLIYESWLRCRVAGSIPNQARSGSGVLPTRTCSEIEKEIKTAWSQ